SSVDRGELLQMPQRAKREIERRAVAGFARRCFEGRRNGSCDCSGRAGKESADQSSSIYGQGTADAAEGQKTLRAANRRFDNLGENGRALAGGREIESGATEGSVRKY